MQPPELAALFRAGAFQFDALGVGQRLDPHSTSLAMRCKPKLNGLTLDVPQRRLGKFEVWVYTRSERGHQPHVHVFYGGAEVVIFIGPRAEVRENPGAMKIKDVREAQLVIADHHAELLSLWSQYNG